MLQFSGKHHLDCHAFDERARHLLNGNHSIFGLVKLDGGSSRHGQMHIHHTPHLVVVNAKGSIVCLGREVYAPFRTILAAARL